MRCTTWAVDTVHHLLGACGHIDCKTSGGFEPRQDVPIALLSMGEWMLALAYDDTRVESVS
jgi:hypothetical protein